MASVNTPEMGRTWVAWRIQKLIHQLVINAIFWKSAEKVQANKVEVWSLLLCCGRLATSQLLGLKSMRKPFPAIEG
jgi:hypothetical protein